MVLIHQLSTSVFDIENQHHNQQEGYIMKNDKKIKKKPLVTLDIGTNNIKVAVGRYANNKINIKKVVQFETPENVISNGRITDTLRLSEAIKEGLKTHNIKEKYAVVNINSSSIINRELSIPYNDDPAAIEKIVMYEMKQLTAIKVELYITQYQIIEEYFDEKVKYLKILVTSIEKEMVERYLKMVKDVGLKPCVLDVHFNTICKFFQMYDQDLKEDKTIAIIDIGYNSTDVTLIKDGNFKMSKTLDQGSNLLEALFRTEFKLDFDENNANALFSKGQSEYQDRIKSVINPLIDEINDIIRYHISRDSQNNVDNIFVTGGLANISEIVKYIEDSIGFTVYEFKILDKILVGYDGKYEIPEYINVLGALIRR